MAEYLYTIITGVVGAFTTIAGIFTTLKTKKSVTSLKSEASMFDRMLTDIMQAEETYTSFKNKGIDASSFKKQYVMNDLQIYALNNNLEFDSEAWSEQIESMIQFSEKVNAKNN